MKKLFLASVARNTLDKFVEIFNCDAKKMNVAFIPTAGNIMSDTWFITEDRNKLVEMGFNVIDINLENKTKDQLLNEMTDVDIIFVAGGNTFYLLQETIKSGFNEIIISFVNHGGIYIGSSAGTLLAGPSIELAKDIDNQKEAPELESFDGLNLVNFVCLPHSDDEWFKEKINQSLQKLQPYKYKTIPLSDKQAVVVKGDDFDIINQ